MSLRQDTPCPELARTPDNAMHFFGFHDLCPWDAADRELVVLRVADTNMLRMPTADDEAQVAVWNPESGEVRSVGVTTAWNWQQAARQQWRPGRERSIVYNTLQDGKPVAVEVDADSGESRTLSDAVYCLSADGNRALAPDFVRLHHAWPAYGYPGQAKGALAGIPDDDGVWEIDLETGGKKLLLSIADIAAVGECVTPPETVHFVSHMAYNPSGTRFCFFHRFFMSDGNMYTRFMSANADASGLRKISDEKASHFDWFDDDTVCLWTRFLPKGVAAARRGGILSSPLLRPVLNQLRKLKSGMKQRLWKEGYYMLKVDGSEGREPLGHGILDADGHPMFNADRSWMLVDTYPDEQGGYNLMLYNMATGVRYDMAHHTSPPQFSRDLKCDHHPRFNRAQNLVCIDSPQTGTRQVHILDPKPVFEAAGK